MVDPLSPSTRFLLEVAGRLHLPAAVHDDVIHELAAHLEDAIQDAVERGVPRHLAEMHAVERMGDPKRLALRIRATHQRTRRLMAAAGGSILPAIGNAIGGYFIGMAVTFTFGAIGTLALALLLQVTGGVSAVWLEQPWVITLAGASASAFAIWFGVSKLVEVVADRSGLDPHEVWRPVAAVATIVIAFLLLTAVSSHNVITVMAFLLLMPLASVSAWWVAHQPKRFGRITQRVLATFALWTVGGVLVFMIVTIVAQGLASALGLKVEIGSITVGSGPLPTGRPVVDVVDEVRDPTVFVIDDFAYSERDPQHRISIDRAPSVAWERLRGLRLEIWPAVDTGWSQPAVIIDSAATRPLLEYTVEPGGRGVTIELPRKRDLMAVAFVLTGVDVDSGDRVAIGMATTHAAPFYGSVIDWLLAD